ncbi:unnamed protein product [Ectocarpus sp. 8 AP-2014]
MFGVGQISTARSWRKLHGWYIVMPKVPDGQRSREFIRLGHHKQVICLPTPVISSIVENISSMRSRSRIQNYEYCCRRDICPGVRKSAFLIDNEGCILGRRSHTWD